MKKAKSNNKLGVYSVGVATIVASIVLYQYFKPASQPATSIGINEVAESPKFGLTVQPANQELDLSFKTPVKIVLNSGTSIRDGDTTNTPAPNKLIAATVEFSYDPDQIEITDLVKGDYFPNTFASPVIDPINKKVTFSFGVSPSDGGKSGSGVLASFNVKPKVSGKSKIAFGTMVEDPRNSGCGIPKAANEPQGTVVNGDAKKTAIACPRIYYQPIIKTNTDIRAEGIDRNLFLDNLYVRKGRMVEDPMAVNTTNSADLAEANKMISYVSTSLDYTFATKERTASDIVDDSDKPGDQVNAQDYAQFGLDFNKANAVGGWIRSDINKDGKVNIADYATLFKEWGL